ncbi:hypothetical protein PVAND_015051 [Polypedilum vanderplanki]|uniref:Uncharacterized protein n=1 Tax=Polypedilum vanderplanki TaxID=319348 RepID=A0A9J6BBH5_POLVA|nr:hypothetical protein PVAND_015051 [Polypedilum vanderplanki]
MVLMKIVEKDRTSNTISKAFIDVINAFFMSNQIAFNVVILKPMSASYAEVVDKTLTEMKDNQPIYIRNIDLTKGRTFNTSLSTVFFTKNANILQFATKVVSTDPRNLKLLIYAPNCNEIKDRTTSILLKNNSTNIGIALYSYFFCQHENTLMLLTWECYTAKNACNKRKLFIINQFNMQNMEKIIEKLQEISQLS